MALVSCLLNCWSRKLGYRKEAGKAENTAGTEGGVVEASQAGGLAQMSWSLFCQHCLSDSSCFPEVLGFVHLTPKGCEQVSGGVILGIKGPCPMGSDCTWSGICVLGGGGWQRPSCQRFPHPHRLCGLPQWGSAGRCWVQGRECEVDWRRCRREVGAESAVPGACF